jgi:hypothetical protein
METEIVHETLVSFDNFMGDGLRASNYTLITYYISLKSSSVKRGDFIPVTF